MFILGLVLVLSRSRLLGRVMYSLESRMRSMSDEIIGKLLALFTIGAFKTLGVSLPKDKACEMLTSWKTPDQFLEKALGRKFGQEKTQLVEEAKAKLPHGLRQYSVADVGFVHPITPDYKKAFKKNIARATKLREYLTNDSSAIRCGLMTADFLDEPMPSNDKYFEFFETTSNEVVMTNGNGRLFAIYLALHSLEASTNDKIEDDEVEPKNLLKKARIEGIGIASKNLEKSLATIRKLSGGDRFNPLQQSLDELKDCIEKDKWEQIKPNPATRNPNKTSWLVAVMAWIYYGIWGSFLESCRKNKNR